MIKYTPQHFLGYSILIYIVLFVVGPYSYELRSGWALLYLVFAYFLWFLGIKLSYVLKSRVKTREENKSFSDFSETILIIIELVTMLAVALYLGYYTINILGIRGFGDTRLQAGQLPSILKLIQYESYMAVGVYIIVSSAEQVRSRWLKAISKIGLLFPIAVTLISGARWTLFVVMLIFFVVEFSKENKLKVPMKVKLIMLGIIASLLVICFFLFASRGTSTTYLTYMPYYGDIETKGIWEFIGKTSLGKPVYSIFFYFTHSVPYYSEVFDLIEPNKYYYGAYMFRLFSFIIDAFPQYTTVLQEVPCLIGSYSTFITGYIRDWGFVGTMPAVFATGWIMGTVNKLKNHRKIACYMQPYFLVMCILSPLYYNWHVGGMDFMIVMTLALHVMLKITNRIYIKNKE